MNQYLRCPYEHASPALVLAGDAGPRCYGARARWDTPGCTSDNGSWAQHLADDSVPVFHLLGLVAWRPWCVPRPAHHAVCGRDVGHIPETRWLANLIGVADMDTNAEDDAAPDASTRDAGAEHAS